MKRPEDQIQRTVFQHVARRCAPDAFVFAVPNGGRRSRIEASIMKGLGTTAGVPDICGLKSGRFFALELKTRKGKLSPRQRAIIDRIESCGGLVDAAFGLDDAIARLEAWGVLRGRAT